MFLYRYFLIYRRALWGLREYSQQIPPSNTNIKLFLCLLILPIETMIIEVDAEVSKVFFFQNGRIPWF